MTNEEIQSIMNSTFSGLAIFCRDLDLDENLISNYTKGQIILERGFTDVSHRIGGLAKNCRYLVASSNGKDLSAFSPNPELGHIVIQSGAFYKVLDIQKGGEKTQIVLLNIPEEGVPIFAKSTINLEDQVIERAQEIFKERIASEPLAELQSDDWIERTSYPLGMSEDGVFFLEMNNAQKAPAQQSNEKEQKQKTHQAEIINNSPPQKKSFWNKLFGK